MIPRDVDTTRRPFVLVWELTQACELACKHCRAEADPHRHPDELSTAEGKRLLDDVRRFGEGQLVVLSGGDPLARDDAVDLVEYGTDLGLRMTLTPSGTASLTPGRIRTLADAGLRRLALSLDGGAPATHDEFRGEPGSFESTLRAARAAQSADLPLQINTTVCVETVDALPAVRDLVADIGAVLWSVFFLVPVGRGRVLDPVSPERAERVMEWLCAVADDAPFGVKTTEAPHYRRVAVERGDRTDAPGGPPPDGIGRRTGITAGDGFAFVSHRGEVFPSGFLPLSAGDVRDDRVVEVYRDADRFRSLRDPDALRGTCGACEYRHLCGGSRSRAFAYTGDPLESDPLCAHVPEGYRGPFPQQSFSEPTDRPGTGGATRASAGGSSSPASDGEDADPETARRTIRDRANEVKRRELRTALDRLEAQGCLSPAERRVVTGMATDIVDGIIAAFGPGLDGPAASDPDAL